MKTPIFKKLVTLTATLGFLSPALHAAEQPNIQVTGTSTLHVDADYLAWKVSIRTVEDTLRQSQATNESALGNLLKVLEELKVEKDDRIILQISHGKNTYYDRKQGKQVQNGFYSKRSVVFNLRDTSKHADILTKLVEFKHLEVDDVTFKTSKETELQQKARTAALKNARTKATEMANVLDMKIGTPTEIKEVSSSNREYLLSEASEDPFASSRSASKSFSLDKVTIKQAVKVTFSITPK